ncbi:hypothetical protein PHYBOEH_008118 [Phytophthora boehmeriae]|uniref:Annexin (Annexin) Family n=1 Tax=Phytophthora boehmeriae TaxID=109152 RepID=A0A8T1W3C5_9STRA|nr:hypothetical protein PHYBOEH_008118 [Phytophthora boehmeriae]
MGGAESTEMDAKKQQAAAGGKSAEKTVKTVEGGVTTYTTTTSGKSAVADFEAVSEQKSSKGPGAEPETEPHDRQKIATSGDGDDVKTEVFRSVEADGCIVVKKTVKTTTRTSRTASGEVVTTVEVETTTETETKSGEKSTTVETETREETETEMRDARDNVSGSVTERGGYAVTTGWTDSTDNVSGSVTERGGYAVTTGWTDSTGATQEVTEATTVTTETTETSGAPATLTTGSGEITETTEVVTEETSTEETTETTETTTKTNVTKQSAGFVESFDDDAFVVIDLCEGSKISTGLDRQDGQHNISWLQQFVVFCESRGQKVSNLEKHTLHELSRAFCVKNFSSFNENLYNGGSLDEKRALWNFSRTLSLYIPELAVHDLGVETGKHKRVLMIEEISNDTGKASKAVNVEVLKSLLNEAPQLSSRYANVVITEERKVVFYGSAKSLMALSDQLGSPQQHKNDISGFLLGLSINRNASYQVTVIDGANEAQDNQRSENLSSLVNFADDTVLFASGTSKPSQTTMKFVDDDAQPAIHEDKHDSIIASSSMHTKKPKSSPVVTTNTAAMRGLYVRHAHEGSISESTTFSADIDAAAQEIQRVCTGAATDEAALASLLLSKTAEQRYLIWWRYRILYKQSLSVWVKSTSDYGVLLKMLSSPLEHVEAEILRKATKGLGTTEEWIYPVVMARSNVEIALLKKTFQEKYGEDLVKIMRGELSSSLRRVIMTALQGDMAAFDPAVHTSAKAAADADALYKAGEGKWGTDEEPFIRIVVLSPPEHLRNIDAVYSKKYQYKKKPTNVIKAIKGEFSGDAQTALLFRARMVFEPFELLADLFERTMKGMGTDEYALSTVVVRYHAMLPQIKTAYKKLYGKELSKRIRGDTSGEYRDLLLALVDGQ